MSFKIDGVEPTTINYNGTDLTDLKVDGTYVWGKPFTLSISTDANVTVTVTRTSSPYQNASLGELSTGSLIYYGDAITILAQRKSGYYISSLLVNDKQYIDNSTTREIETYWTVNQPITISATSIAAVSWHTVWTGSKEYFSTSGGSTFQPTNTTTTHKLDVITLSNYPNVQKMQLIGVGKLKKPSGEVAEEISFDVTVNVGNSNVTLVVLSVSAATQYVSLPNKTSCTITTNSGKVPLAKVTGGVVLKTINLYY
jgi:hypothetical protein